MQKRIEFIDIAKGIGIILMVIGHTNPPQYVFNYIYIFHMPLFFILSGYFFNQETLRKPATFIYKKIKGLYIPYIKWGILFIILHNLFYLCHINKDFYSLNEYPSIIYNLLKMEKYELLLGPFWFFRELLLTSILVFSIFFVGNKIKIQAPIRKLIIPFLLIIAVVCSKYNVNLPIIGYRTLTASCFFISGYYFKEHQKAIIDKIFNYYTFFIFIIIIAIFAYIHPTYIGSISFDIPIAYILGIIGTITVIFISSKIKSSIKNFFIFCGRNTISIMALHLLSFKIVSYIKIILYNLDIQKLADWPVISNTQQDNIFWIVYAAVGVLVPTTIILLQKKLISSLTVKEKN